MTTRRWIPFAVGVAAAVLALSGYILWSRGAGIANDLSDSALGGGGFVQSQKQEYLRGTAVFVSTPLFGNSGKAPIHILSALPVVTGPCSIHVVSQMMFNAYDAAWVGTGQDPASADLRPFGVNIEAPLSRVAIRPEHQASLLDNNWFDAVSFRVNGFCRFHVSGFNVHFREGNQEATEFLSDNVTFVPVSRLT